METLLIIIYTLLFVAFFIGTATAFYALKFTNALCKECIKKDKKNTEK